MLVSLVEPIIRPNSNEEHTLIRIPYIPRSKMESGTAAGKMAVAAANTLAIKKCMITESRI